MQALPRYYEIARAEIGVREVRGSSPSQSNSRIDEYLRTVGLSNDATPWCAAFVGWCLEEAGLEGTHAANARSYERWGVEVGLRDAREGDLVVFSRGSSEWQGHVGFFVRWDGDLAIVVGGNQSDMVSEASFGRWHLLAVRRPKAVSESKSVAAGAGALASTAAERTIEAVEQFPVTEVVESAPSDIVGATSDIAAKAGEAHHQVQQLLPLVSNNTLKAIFIVIGLLCTAYMIYDRVRKIRRTCR